MTNVIETANATVIDLRQAQKAHLASIQRVEENKDLSPEGKRLRIAALTDGLEQNVIQKRERLLTSLRADVAEGERRLEVIEQAARIQPRSTEAWALANSRARFVREDADRLADAGNPGSIVGAFRQAVRDENEVEAYLWLRYGRKALERIESRQLDRLEAEVKAIEGKRMEAAGVSQVRLELDQVNAAIQALDDVRTPSEIGDLRIRFGIA
jgi:hypothetical protein